MVPEEVSIAHHRLLEAGRVAGLEKTTGTWELEKDVGTQYRIVCGDVHVHSGTRTIAHLGRTSAQAIKTLDAMAAVFQELAR